MPTVTMFPWMAVLLAGSGALGACVSITDPPLPYTATPFTPPAVYARWWAMTEACSGLTGSLAAISFYEVPGATSISNQGSDVRGYWSLASNRIVLAGSTTLDGPLVRHEMLHALIGRDTYFFGHPRVQFLDRCGGVVVCDRSCLDDAGPAPRAAAGTVPALPESLEMSIAMEPGAPSSADADGFFTVTVYARNPAPHPVIVTLPAAGVGNALHGFDYEIRTSSTVRANTVGALDASRWTFAAGERKQRVFDFHIGSGSAPDELPPGEYWLRGAYGGNWSEYVTLTLIQ